MLLRLQKKVKKILKISKRAKTQTKANGVLRQIAI